MNAIIFKYINSIKKRDLSKNTLDAYVRDLHNFFRFLETRDENYIEVDKVTIMAFVQYLKRERKANSSIVRNIISIRNFYKYLIKEKIVEDNPTEDYEVPKIKRNIPKTLTIEEVDLLLKMPDHESIKGKRDKAMLELMYATGMKVSELLDLSVFNINLHLGYITCIGSKNSERNIPIGSYAINCLRDYLTVREKLNIYNYDLLFLNSKGGRMSRQGFWKIVKGYAEEANITKSMNLYTLRHSFAVHLLQNGANMSAVQQLLGHRNMSATQIYSQISKGNKIADIYKKAHPRA